ncbi:hypothetical protein QC761_508034 [Podospora bellae-mahoneyi]|uniref:Uncharacterized protein n=1 Tax=Podospora bellae-mahoneyi TaxID=2093777 RepID=A0ABR0FHJ5_9PEZI|nr:hypothetical protein QC761_508034 [Podospora bellae-mahoneyi]
MDVSCTRWRHHVHGVREQDLALLVNNTCFPFWTSTFLLQTPTQLALFQRTSQQYHHKPTSPGTGTMSTSKIFPWSSIKPKLLTSEGRFIYDDSIYADVACDILTEAAKRNPLQEMLDDALRALKDARKLRESGGGGNDAELQFAFFFILIGMVTVQLRAQEREVISEKMKGSKSPGCEGTDSGLSDGSGQSGNFVKIDLDEIRDVMAREGVKRKSVLNKVSEWVFGKGKK